MMIFPFNSHGYPQVVEPLNTSEVVASTPSRTRSFPTTWTPPPGRLSVFNRVLPRRSIPPLDRLRSIRLWSTAIVWHFSLILCWRHSTSTAGATVWIYYIVSLPDYVVLSTGWREMLSKRAKMIVLVLVNHQWWWIDHWGFGGNDWNGRKWLTDWC